MSQTTADTAFVSSVAVHPSPVHVAQAIAKRAQARQHVENLARLEKAAESLKGRKLRKH